MPNKPAYVTSAVIESATSVGKALFVLMFWLWGLGGFIGLTFAIMGLPTSVTIGNSAYLTLCAVYWLGGMVLFGLGALLPRNSLEFKRPVDPT